MRRGFFCKAPPTFVSFDRRRVSSFFLAGLVGATVSGPAGMILASALSLSPGVVALLWLLALGTLLALAKAAQVLTGEPSLVYYRHEIAILAVAAVALELLGLPLLPYLDIVILGVGVFLVFGRVGCFAVGCCHGRPASWGVRYSEAHASEGFSEYLVDVPLMPIQLVESLWALCIVVIGGILLLGGASPGTALVWYTLAYGVARFALEIARGDTGRPFPFGLSEAQWVSVALALTVLWGKGAGHLPQLFSRPVLWTLVVVILAVPALLAIRARSPVRRITTPSHVAELARGMDALTSNARPGMPDPDAVVPLFQTSLGLCVSYGCYRENATRTLHHYALSSQKLHLSEKEAGRLASIISRLRHAGRHWELRAGAAAAHVLVPDDDTVEGS